MVKTELSQEELKRATGGISMENGIKLANKLMDYYHQGRLGLNQFQIIRIKEAFENGDDKEIIRTFNLYHHEDSDLAWTELHNMYNSLVESEQNI